MIAISIYLYAGLAFAELFRVAIFESGYNGRRRLRAWEYAAFILLWPVILTFIMMRNWNRG